MPTVVQIADFGMARDLEESEYYISQGGKVPVKWTAPEVGPHIYNALSTISCCLTCLTSQCGVQII